MYLPFYQKNLRSRKILPPPRSVALIALLALSVIGSPPLIAQSFEELLDSAILYERLKVAHVEQIAANELQKEYSRSLEMSLRRCRWEADSVQKANLKTIATLQADWRKRQRKSNRKAFGLGAVIAETARIIFKILR